MGTLRQLRAARGLSQRRLAARAGVSFRTLQLLEAGGRGPRWTTLVKLAGPLGIEPAELVQVLGLAPGSAEKTLRGFTVKIVREGEQAWRSHLFEFVDAFRRDPSTRLVEDAPDPRLSRPVLALVASTVESLCGELRVPVPWWSAGVPGPEEPWFVAATESLKASALVESPACYRRRNIFVLGNFLSRA